MLSSHKTNKNFLFMFIILVAELSGVDPKKLAQTMIDKKSMFGYVWESTKENAKIEKGKKRKCK